MNENEQTAVQKRQDALVKMRNSNIKTKRGNVPMDNTNSDATVSSKSSRSAKDIIKIIIAITIALIAIAVTSLLCLVIYKNGLTTESILSMLLAFFAIFISIFFYFKADETSNKFYISSYAFMKDQAVLLGRIEERFGEKFENLFSRIDHLDVGQAEKEDQIENKREEISQTVNEILSYLSHSSEEQSTEGLKEELEVYQKRLEEKNIEYNELLNNLHDIRLESQDTRHFIETLQRLGAANISDEVFCFFTELDMKDINYLKHCGERIQRSNRTFRIAKKYNLCDENGLMSQGLKMWLQKATLAYQYSHKSD